MLFSFRARRDFRRSAVPRLITPFCAALSRCPEASRYNPSAASESPTAMAASAFFNVVLNVTFRLLFTSAFLLSARMCFTADFLWGNSDYLPNYALIQVLAFILNIHTTSDPNVKFNTTRPKKPIKQSSPGGGIQRNDQLSG